MTRLAIDIRNQELARQIRENVDRIQTQINLAKASVANAKEREETLRAKENEWRDEHNIKRETS